MGQHAASESRLFVKQDSGAGLEFLTNEKTKGNQQLIESVARDFEYFMDGGKL